MKPDKQEQDDRKLERLTADEQAALETQRLEDARGGTQGSGGQGLTEKELGGMGGG